MINYRDFKLSKLNTPEYSHLKYLIFWPLYGLAFLILERFTTLDYHYMHCALDDMIPFVEWFVIPYLFWFVYIVGMLLYALLFDSECFKYLMKMIIIICTISCVVYVIYPSAQALRPETLPRDNFLSAVVRAFYVFDTNTNVCPSVHVATSFAILFAGRKSKFFSTPFWRVAFTVITVMITLATMFIKQHSAIDVFWGIVTAIIAYAAVRGYDCFKLKEISKSTVNG